MGLRGPRSISASIRRISSQALTFSTEAICTNEAMDTPVAACSTRAMYESDSPEEPGNCPCVSPAAYLASRMTQAVAHPKLCSFSIAWEYLRS